MVDPTIANFTYLVVSGVSVTVAGKLIYEGIQKRKNNNSNSKGVCAHHAKIDECIENLYKEIHQLREHVGEIAIGVAILKDRHERKNRSESI